MLFGLKKRGGTFNARCKNTVFRFPVGSGKLHPTEKNHKLLRELILDNSNESDLVFDPCAGAGSSLLVAQQLNRRVLGCEIDEDYCALANERLEQDEFERSA
ncbi:MAG: site-specific DNA-methyltransferase [Candidatus Gastranaerophilales bacterium]|nr:site-specific DNA-methyltransferase [Candidatus Gastranaerophilales bacterium]